jgi:hypothetical protein
MAAARGESGRRPRVSKQRFQSLVPGGWPGPRYWRHDRGGARPALPSAAHRCRHTRLTEENKSARNRKGKVGHAGLGPSTSPARELPASPLFPGTGLPAALRKQRLGLQAVAVGPAEQFDLVLFIRASDHHQVLRGHRGDPRRGGFNHRQGGLGRRPPGSSQVFRNRRGELQQPLVNCVCVWAASGAMLNTATPLIPRMERRPLGRCLRRPAATPALPAPHPAPAAG